LTRRANHRHIFIIAEIAKARAGKPAAGFFIRNLESGFPNRTAAAFHGRTISSGTHRRKTRLKARCRPSLKWGMIFSENRFTLFRIML
jgi:hypothetical protein